MDIRDFYEESFENTKRLRLLEDHVLRDYELKEDEDESDTDDVEKKAENNLRDVTVSFSIHADRESLVGKFAGAVNPKSGLMFFYTWVDYRMHAYILDEEIPMRIINNIE